MDWQLLLTLFILLSPLIHSLLALFTMNVIKTSNFNKINCYEYEDGRQTWHSIKYSFTVGLLACFGQSFWRKKTSILWCLTKIPPVFSILRKIICYVPLHERSKFNCMTAINCDVAVREKDNLINFITNMSCLTWVISLQYTLLVGSSVCDPHDCFQ